MFWQCSKFQTILGAQKKIFLIPLLGVVWESHYSPCDGLSIGLLLSNLPPLIASLSHCTAQVKKTTLPAKLHKINQGCGSGSWKRKWWKRLIFCGSDLMKEVGSGSESVEKELETEAFFSKSGASGFFKLATTVGVKCNNNNITSRCITMCA